MQKLCPKSPNGANSPSFYFFPRITTFDHTQISLLPVPKFQPASGKPRPRAGVLKFLTSYNGNVTASVTWLLWQPSPEGPKVLLADPYLSHRSDRGYSLSS